MVFIVYCLLAVGARYDFSFATVVAYSAAFQNRRADHCSGLQNHQWYCTFSFQASRNRKIVSDSFLRGKESKSFALALAGC